MNTRRLLLLSALLTAPLAFAQDLTLAELARRPEFLPAQVTLKQPVKLQGRPAINAGQKLTVVSIRGTSVEVETPDGRSVFNVKADDTDVLASAQATYQKLTPEQRALTYQSLLQRKDLWPYRVKLTQLMRLSGGDLKPGFAAILVGTEGGNLLLVNEQGKDVQRRAARHRPARRRAQAARRPEGFARSRARGPAGQAREFRHRGGRLPRDRRRSEVLRLLSRRGLVRTVPAVFAGAGEVLQGREAEVSKF
jgi:hypothetical protein